jgi:hypothetical protein
LTEARRKDLEAYVAKFKERHDKLQEEQDALGRERIRFSNDVPWILSIVCDELIKQLLEHAMDRVLLADKKIIQVSHMHEEGVDKLTLYPLVANLRLWKNPPEAPLKKNAKKGAAMPQNVPAPEPVEHDKYPFKYYVAEICANLISPEVTGADGKVTKQDNGKYAVVRVSEHIKKYCSDLLVQLLERLAPLVQLKLEAMNVKTITNTAIMSTIQEILEDGQEPVEELKYETKLAADPEEVKKEKAKRKTSKQAKMEAEVQGKAYVETNVFRTPEEIPKTNQLVVTKTLKFKNSRFETLRETIDRKLAECKKDITEEDEKV